MLALSKTLRKRGWQVPAYTFPEHREDLSVLRVVCRNGFSHDPAELLLNDIHAAVAGLTADSRPGVDTGAAAFRH